MREAKKNPPRRVDRMGIRSGRLFVLRFAGLRARCKHRGVQAHTDMLKLAPGVACFALVGLPALSYVLSD
jgi:hypothetical protein